MRAGCVRAPRSARRRLPLRLPWMVMAAAAAFARFFERKRGRESAGECLGSGCRGARLRLGGIFEGEEGRVG